MEYMGQKILKLLQFLSSSSSSSSPPHVHSLICHSMSLLNWKLAQSISKAVLVLVVVVAIKMNWFPFNFPQSHEIFGTHSYTLKWAQNAVTIGLRNQTIAAKTLPSSSHDDIGSNQCNNDKRHLLDPR